MGTREAAGLEEYPPRARLLRLRRSIEEEEEEEEEEEKRITEPQNLIRVSESLLGPVACVGQRSGLWLAVYCYGKSVNHHHHPSGWVTVEGDTGRITQPHICRISVIRRLSPGGQIEHR